MALNPSFNFSIPKLMWTKEYKPENTEKRKKILLYADYIIYMLTGEAQKSTILFLLPGQWRLI